MTAGEARATAEYCRPKRAVGGQEPRSALCGRGDWTYTLSTLPTFGQPVTMLVGYEPQDDGSVRVYLGARHKGLYLLVTDSEEQDFFRRGWESIRFGNHCWMWPLPSADLIHREERVDVT